MNRPIRIPVLLLVLSAALTLPVSALGERVERAVREHGTYAVHHNALTTDRLPPSVARAYGLRRSSAIALINIAVVREIAGTTGISVRAQVTLTVSNLAGQPKSVTALQEVIEGDAIYYLATTGIAPHETLVIQVEVVPEGELRPIRFRYTQTFD